VNDSYAQLTDLDVCFTRVEEYDRDQTSDIEFPLQVRRLERDDAPIPLDGDFRVECQGKWLWWVVIYVCNRAVLAISVV